MVEEEHGVFSMDFHPPNETSAIQQRKSFQDVVRILQVKHSKTFTELRYDPRNEFAVFCSSALHSELNQNNNNAVVVTLTNGFSGEVLMHVQRIKNKASPTSTTVLRVDCFGVDEIERQILEALF
jgi:hypothetical protein